MCSECLARSSLGGTTRHTANAVEKRPMLGNSFPPLPLPLIYLFFFFLVYVFILDFGNFLVYDNFIDISREAAHARTKV